MRKSGTWQIYQILVFIRGQNIQSYGYIYAQNYTVNQMYLELNLNVQTKWHKLQSHIYIHIFANIIPFINS